MKSLAKRIAHALEEVESAKESENPVSLLPDIQECLKHMEKSITASVSKRRSIANALGRIITENLAFAESELGRLLLKLADDFEGV